VNILDIAIVVVALIIIVRGYLRGMIREVASLGGLVLGLIIGARFYTQAGRLLEQAFGPSEYLPLAGFALLFLVTWLLASIIGAQVSRIVASGPASDLNKALGLILGAAKAVLVVVIGVVILSQALTPKSPLLAKSRLAPLAWRAADWGRGQLPESFQKSLAERKDQLLKKPKSGPKSSERKD